jgi:hypothetical protein
VQIAVELVGFAALVIQSSLGEFTRRLVHHRNLLVARVKITSYNHHCSAPFFRALVVYSCQVYSVKGADAVIQSAQGQQRRFRCLRLRVKLDFGPFWFCFSF